MTDIEKITLKIQDIQVDIESLRRELKNKEPQKVEKVTIDVDSIVDQAVSECKKLILPIKAQHAKEQKNLKDAIKKIQNDVDDLKSNVGAITKTAGIEIATAIDKKVNIDFINNLYRNR